MPVAVPPTAPSTDRVRRARRAVVPVALAALAASIATAAPAFAAADRPTVGGVFAPAVRGAAVTVSGWAADRDRPSAPVRVSVLVDGAVKARVTTAIARPRVAQAYHVGPRAGFAAHLTLPAGAHRVCASARDLETGRAAALGCRSLTVAPVRTSSTSGSVNAAIAREAARYVGARYVEGGASPRTGFDCSGLVSWVYAQAAHISLPHYAETQFQRARRISEAAAQPGDLVFFHDGGGYVYHVGIVAGHHMMWAAATPQDGVRYQSIWSSAVTFGTLTH
ncbi:MAG: C40 family peptidase [Jatrophihabitans sp.]|uniref:C40 family peptidase n=1 Tax=Jatrophihabitans sp. TaxID=1932789 RepID=UPI003F7E6EB0